MVQHARLDLRDTCPSSASGFSTASLLSLRLPLRFCSPHPFARSNPPLPLRKSPPAIHFWRGVVARSYPPTGVWPVRIYSGGARVSQALALQISFVGGGIFCASSRTVWGSAVSTGTSAPGSVLQRRLHHSHASKVADPSRKSGIAERLPDLLVLHALIYSVSLVSLQK